MSLRSSQRRKELSMNSRLHTYPNKMDLLKEAIELLLKLLGACYIQENYLSMSGEKLLIQQYLYGTAL